MDANWHAALLGGFAALCSKFSDLQPGADEFRHLPDAVGAPLHTIWERGLKAFAPYPALNEAVGGRISCEVISKLWWILFMYFVKRCEAALHGAPMPASRPKIVVGETQVCPPTLGFHRDAVMQ